MDSGRAARIRRTGAARRFHKILVGRRRGADHKRLSVGRMKASSLTLAKRILGWLVVATAMAFFIHRVVVNAGHMPHVAWNATAVAVGIGSSVVAAFAIVLSAVIWQVLLRDQAL